MSIKVGDTVEYEGTVFKVGSIQKEADGRKGYYLIPLEDVVAWEHELTLVEEG